MKQATTSARLLLTAAAVWAVIAATSSPAAASEISPSPSWTPAIESQTLQRWEAAARSVERAIDRQRLRQAERELTELTADAPGWSRAESLRESLVRAQVIALIDAEDPTAALRAGDLLLEHGYTDENIALFVSARSNRMRSFLMTPASDRTINGALQAWIDAEAVMRYRTDRITPQQLHAIIDAGFAASRVAGTLDEVDELTRHVSVWAGRVTERATKQEDGNPPEIARSLAGFAHYEAATRYWEHHGLMMKQHATKTASYHLRAANELGALGDPRGLRLRLAMVRAAPAIFPLALLLLFGGIGLYYARPRRRFSARRATHRASRLAAEGRFAESAVEYYRAWHLTKPLAPYRFTDFMVMGIAGAGLLRYAIHVGNVADAFAWCRALQNLPFEFRPDDYDELCSIVQAGHAGGDVYSRDPSSSV